MNVPRKPPSVSPPVQVQSQQQSRGTPHYATRGQTPPIAYRPLNQDEFQRNQVYSQAQVSVNNNYSIQFSQNFAGSNPHDMSKQQALPPHVAGPGQNQGQPGLQTQVMYTNPTQQHQGGGPRPGTPSGASPALGGAGYHSANSHGNAGPMQFHPMGASPMAPPSGQEEGVGFTIPRQTVQQPPMRANQQRQQLTMASSPAQTLYNQPVHATTMYVHQQPPPHFMHGQPQVIIQPGPPPPLQVPPQYTAGPRPSMPTQFTITSQQNYMPQQTTNYFNPTTNNPTFYMPQNPGGMVHQQPQRTMNQQPQPYQKRERKIIRIVDPSTGQDISDEIMSSTTKSNTPPHSGPNSSRATPVTGPPAGTTPPPVTTSTPNTAPPQPKPETTQTTPVDIAAQFAAQVAATLSQKTNTQQQLQPLTPGLPPPEGEELADTEQPEVAVTESEEPCSTETPSSDTETKQSQSREASQPKEEAPPSDPVPEEIVEPESVVPVTITPPTPEAHAHKEASPEVPPEEVPEKEVPEKEVEEVKETEEKEVEEVVAEPPAEKEEPALVEPPPAEMEPESTPAVDESKDNESKEKKKSKKQKQKELNQKGESKEGTDMDAFSMPSTTSTPPPAQPQAQAAREQTPPTTTNEVETKTEVVAEPVPEEEPAPSPPAETKAELTVEEPPIEKVEIKVVEDEKVAEKNEKNEKNEEPWRKLTSDEPWRKPKSSADSWRKSPSTVEEDRRITSSRVEEDDIPTTNSSDTTSTTTSEKNALNDKSSSNITSSTSSSSTSSSKAAEKSTTSSKISDTKPVIDKDSSDLKHKYREGQNDGSVDSNNRTASDVQNNQTQNTNPSGRKSYDRNFLLQMQFSSESLEKPDGLPRLPDVILDKPLSRNDSSRGIPALKPGSVVDFTPGFFKTTPAGGKVPSIGRNRSQQKNVKGDGPKRIITIAHLDTKLHQSENAWKPSAHQPRKPAAAAGAGENDSESETEEILKTVRAILNKLTPEKFQTLIKQIVNLKLDTFDRLKRAIDLIFEKAIDEPAFSSTYANLCKCMCPIKVPAENKPEDSVAFKKLLLLRCQTEFEKDRSDEVASEKAHKVISEKKKLLSESGPNKELEREIALLEENSMLAEQKSRRRYLGNIRFIGELFKLGILNEPIMHSCLTKLLGAMDEESLECLCRLLTTIGKSIDTEERDKKAKIDEYFNKLTRLAGDRKISARIRFMIQDIIDLRLNRWVPRRDDNKPKTIRELHKEIQLEDQQKQQNLSNIIQMSKPSGGHHGDGGRGRRGRGAGNVNEDGWQAVASKPLRTQTIEPNKMNQIKLSRHNMDSDNITLGSGFSGWGRGSSGGGGKSSREERSLSSTPNRFSPLSNERNPGRDSYEQGRSGSVGRGGLSQSRDRDRDRERDRDRDRERDRDRSDRGSWTTQARGKNVPRASQEHDREAALSAVRSMAGGGRSTTPTGSRNQSLDKGRREGTREREVEKAPPAPTLSVSEVKKKTEALLSEFLGLLDMNEAIQCVKELESPSLMNVMVSTALNQAIEKRQKDRTNTGQLMAQLLQKKIIKPEDYLSGLDEILEFAEDMAIDIPKIWQYLGELVGPVFDDRAVELNKLQKSLDMIQSSGKSGVFVAEVLKDVASRKSKDHVAQIWFDSGFQWSDFIGDSDVNEFAQRYNVEYLLPSGGPLSTKRLQDELRRLIVDTKATNEVVFEWVAENVGDKPKDAAFTRALMTAVCSSAITENTMKVDNGVIKRRSAMMMKYLDHDAELELQALYALQALVHSLQHPAGLLRSFFDVLYDEDIISEDAFMQWAKSSDPSEQAGKGVAQSSVVQFFTWLREADEESQEDN